MSPTVQVQTERSVTIVCERCNKHEVVDFPENLFDFEHKYGYRFCEDCMHDWIDPNNDLKDKTDKYAQRGLRP